MKYPKFRRRKNVLFQSPMHIYDCEALKISLKIRIIYWLICRKWTFERVCDKHYQFKYWKIGKFCLTSTYLSILWYLQTVHKLIIIGRIILVYYCKCRNLIGYSTRYLFLDRWRVAKQSSSYRDFFLKKLLKNLNFLLNNYSMFDLWFY